MTWIWSSPADATTKPSLLASLKFQNGLSFCCQCGLLYVMSHFLWSDAPMTPAKTAELIRCRLRVPKELCNTEPCITQWSILAPPGEFDRTVGARRRCGLMSNNFGHLLLLQRGQQAGGKSCIAWRRVRRHARWCRLVGGWSAGYRWLVDDVV